MRLLLATVTLPVLLVVAACGDDGASGTATTTLAPAATTTPLPATTAAPASSTAVTTAAATTTTPITTTPITTTATTTPATTVDVGRIEVDADTDPVRTVSVPLGTPVTLVVRSAVEQEFHLHGYDLELAGTEVTFRFTADQAGTFELETHDTGRQVVILQVG